MKISVHCEKRLLPPCKENNNVSVTERLVDSKTVKLETTRHYIIYSKSFDSLNILIIHVVDLKNTQ